MNVAIPEQIRDPSEEAVLWRLGNCDAATVDRLLSGVKQSLSVGTQSQRLRCVRCLPLFAFWGDDQYVVGHNHPK